MVGTPAPCARDGRPRTVTGVDRRPPAGGDRSDDATELSSKTVRNHLSNILTKLQVADRAQAIVQARESGLGTAN